MKILWISANKLGHELLKEVFNQIKNQVSIITLSKDSKTVMYDGIDSNYWHDFGCDVIQVDRINDAFDCVKEINPDLIIMCGWRQIIDKNILDIPTLGFVGFHPTLLPVGRGSAPIINSILSGYKKSGVTMYHVSEGLDDGDIIGQESFVIEKNDHASDVYEKIIYASKKLIKKYLPLLLENNAPRTKQDEAKATYFKKPSLKDNEIDLKNESKEQIFRKIKALSRPYRGAYIKCGNDKLIIWKAEYVQK